MAQWVQAFAEYEDGLDSNESKSQFSEGDLQVNQQAHIQGLNVAQGKQLTQPGGVRAFPGDSLKQVTRDLLT